MRISSILFCLILFCTACFNPSDIPDKVDERQGDSRLQKIDQLMTSAETSSDFSGVVLLAEGSSVKYHKAFGYAHYEQKTKMPLDALFDIASLNKSMIAAITLIGTKEGKWNLDESFKRIMKRYDMPHSEGFSESMTLRQMLSHTSGLPDYSDLPDSLKAQNFQSFKSSSYNSKSYIALISSLGLKFEPGQAFYYSNFAYHLISLLFEYAYEGSFNEVLQQKLAQPLNWTSTKNRVVSSQYFPKLVEAYVWQNQRWNKTPNVDPSLGRRIWSNSYDMHSWALAWSDTSWLGSDLLDEMKTNQLSAIDSTISYGFGLATHPVNSPYKMGNLALQKHSYLIHGGSTDGYQSLLVSVEEGQTILLLLANSGQRAKLLSTASNILKIYLNYE